MSDSSRIRDHYLPPDPDAFRRAEPATGRVVVIAPTRAACETIELACRLELETVLEREHGEHVRALARRRVGFGVVAGTGTGKTLAIRPIAEQLVGTPLRIGVVNREREATPETPSWNVVIVTTGIARRWFQDELINPRDTLVVDEIHQTSAELELCLALGKRVGCRFIWLSATVDPSFYASYLDSSEVLESSAFDPALAASVVTSHKTPVEFFDERFVRRVVREKRGVAVFLPTRAEVEAAASSLRERWPRMDTAYYHGGEPIRVIRPFLDGTAARPFVLAMTQAGQSALNIQGLDTVVIYDSCFGNVVDGGRNVLTRQFLGPNELLQMAGRVHGRVPGGEVYILSDRDIEFSTLQPGPPDFQLAGDSERVALTAAALGVDLRDLDLPVPLDRRAYADAVSRLETREVVSNGRLTAYGRDVEAMPVDRPWGEILVHAPPHLVPYVAVAANVDSLHRMTREHAELTGLIVWESDHLTSYNVYAEAVNQYGALGEVYGLPRHLFGDGVAAWAEERGVLVKAIEDIALGMASVYRTLELPLPAGLPYANRKVLREFQDLLARVMPLDLVIDRETADGDRARLADSSVCTPTGAVAGMIRYFADRFSVARGALEGTSIPFELIRRYAHRSPPAIEFRSDRRGAGLVLSERTEYSGFVLDRTRRPMHGKFPPKHTAAARECLAVALMQGETPHRDQAALRRTANRIREYWRRSGGTVAGTAPERVRATLLEQLAAVGSWDDFLDTRLELSLDDFVSSADREHLDALPTSMAVYGDRVAVEYDIENGMGVARVRLREKQALRLRHRDLPTVDRPLRFAVMRGRRQVAYATSLDELHAAVRALPHDRPRGRRRRRGHGR